MKKKAKNKGGRPPKYETEQQLVEKIESFFNKCMKKRKGFIPSKAALRLHLNLSKDLYSDYKKRFPNPIKRAEDIIEKAWVERLAHPGATGAIFYLKNAFKDDYREKQEVEHSGKLDISKVLDGLEQEK
jgi:hypothetical protein